MSCEDCWAGYDLQNQTCVERHPDKMYIENNEKDRKHGKKKRKHTKNIQELLLKSEGSNGFGLKMHVETA